MDWLLVLVLFLIVPVWIIGIGAMFFEWKDRDIPFPARPHPSLIFRLVKRDERATYRRIMRRTTAIAMRDFSRQMTIFSRIIGKALLPPLERLAAALSEAFNAKP